VTIDVGTGDGRAILTAAARQPTTLALGLDANAAGMAEASLRAARTARKGGLPNAAFVLAAAESPPTALDASAGLVTVRFPWGSLLRGVVGEDDAVAAGVAGLVAKGGGVLELLLAPVGRDRLDGIPTSTERLAAGAAGAFRAHAFEIEDIRVPTSAEVALTGSTWARRLGPGRRNGTIGDRSATLIRLVRR
jgi:16S rRNA (adenine(1408)-N(1))-methyltransferase